MKIEWKSCFKVCVSIFLLYLCVLYWQSLAGAVLSFLGAALPLFIGGAIAFVLNILMGMFEKWYFPKSTKKIVLKTRRPVCIFAAILALIAIVALVCFLVVPELIDALVLLVSRLPGQIEQFIDWIDLHNLLPDVVLDYLDTINWSSVIDNFVGMIQNGIGNVMNFVISTVSSVVSWVVTIFLSVIFAIYILMSKEKLASQADRVMRRFLHDKWCKKVEYVLHVLNDCFRRYVVGQCVEAVILGTLCALGMWALQLPYATMVGALVAFTALIPIVGAFIGGIVGAIMMLTESPIKAIIFVVFLIILQQIEENLIYPRVVGSSLGLPAIWVLAAVTVGGGVAGVLGMLLGVPLAAAIYRMIRHDMRKYAIREEEELKKAAATADGAPEPPPEEPQKTPIFKSKKKKKG